MAFGVLSIFKILSQLRMLSGITSKEKEKKFYSTPRKTDQERDVSKYSGEE